MFQLKAFCFLSSNDKMQIFISFLCFHHRRRRRLYRQQRANFLSFSRFVFVCVYVNVCWCMSGKRCILLMKYFKMKEEEMHHFLFKIYSHKLLNAFSKHFGWLQNVLVVSECCFAPRPFRIWIFVNMSKLFGICYIYAIIYLYKFM